MFSEISETNSHCSMPLSLINLIPTTVRTVNGLTIAPTSSSTFVFQARIRKNSNMLKPKVSFAGLNVLLWVKSPQKTNSVIGLTPPRGLLVNFQLQVRAPPSWELTKSLWI